MEASLKFIDQLYFLFSYSLYSLINICPVTQVTLYLTFCIPGNILFLESQLEMPPTNQIFFFNLAFKMTWFSVILSEIYLFLLKLTDEGKLLNGFYSEIQFMNEITI